MVGGEVTALLTAPLRMAAAAAVEDYFSQAPVHTVQGASRSPAKAILVEMRLSKPAVQVEEQVARAALGHFPHFPEAMALLALPLLVRPS